MAHEIFSKRAKQRVCQRGGVAMAIANGDTVARVSEDGSDFVYTYTYIFLIDLKI